MEKLKHSSIYISGASGFIGRPLAESLKKLGAYVHNITRKPKGPADVFWNPDEMRITASDLENADIIYHLAGESIASKRWTTCRKNQLILNRENCVRTLRKAISNCKNKPRLVVIASAVGYYGNDNTETVKDEASCMGSNYSAKLCKAIECEAERIAKLGIPVVIARLGVVIGANGGALSRMILPFSLGLGGNIGSGKQPFSWISQTDAVRALLFLANSKNFQNNTTVPNICIANLSTPEPSTNNCLTKSLASALHRPAFMHIPAPIVKLLFGQMGEELLLEGASVYPKHLTQCGFIFKNKTLKSTIAYTLQKKTL